MIFPDTLYRLRPDEVDRFYEWLTPHFDFVDPAGVAAAAVTTTSTPVQADRVLVLTHVLAEFIPGAAQVAVAGFVHLRDAGGVAQARLAFEEFAGGGGTDRFSSWQGELLVPPLWDVTVLGIFDLGVAANIVRLTVAGILLPLGNVQRL